MASKGSTSFKSGALTTVAKTAVGSIPIVGQVVGVIGGIASALNQKKPLTTKNVWYQKVNNLAKKNALKNGISAEQFDANSAILGRAMDVRAADINSGKFTMENAPKVGDYVTALGGGISARPSNASNVTTGEGINNNSVIVFVAIGLAVLLLLKH